MGLCEAVVTVGRALPCKRQENWIMVQHSICRQIKLKLGEKPARQAGMNVLTRVFTLRFEFFLYS